MTVQTIAGAAADWTSEKVSFFLEKENPRTKFDVLACVCSFVAEGLEKREQLSQKKLKKKADEPMSSPRSVLCFLANPPRKSRSKRPRSPRSESELNLCHPPLKKLKDDDAVSAVVPDLGVEKVSVNGKIDFCPKSDAFVIVPQIVQTIDHKVPVSLKKLKGDDAVTAIVAVNPVLGVGKVPVNGRADFCRKGDAFMPQIVQSIDHKVPVCLNKKKNLLCRDNTMSPPVGLREQIEQMNGKEILLLGEKALTDSDVKSNLSRLMMPESQMINSWNFLTDEENAFLKIKNGNKWNGIRVSLIEPCGESRSSVTLRRWEMIKDKGKGSSSVSCVLTSGWNQVVLRNQLKSGNIVQLWSFRVETDLHLALLLI